MAADHRNGHKNQHENEKFLSEEKVTPAVLLGTAYYSRIVEVNMVIYFAVQD